MKRKLRWFAAVLFFYLVVASITGGPQDTYNLHNIAADSAQLAFVLSFLIRSKQPEKG